MKDLGNKPIELALRAFCDSPHRWLVVTAVTSIVTLVTVWPLADDHFAGNDERAELAERLRSARLDAEDLGELENQVQEVKAQLAAITGRTVSESTVGSYRSRLVELARQSNCQVRRISVGSIQTRPWQTGDDPIQGSVSGVVPKKATGLDLQKQTLELSISGSMSGLNSLLEQIHDEARLMHVKNLEIRPGGPNRKQVLLDLELWFFSLARGATAS